MSNSFRNLLQDLTIRIVNGRLDAAATRRTLHNPERELPSAVIGSTLPFGDSLGGATLKLPHAERLQHVYATGATGVGKTTLQLTLLDHDLSEHRSIWVVDLRGDLIARVLKRIATLPETHPARRKLCLIDFAEDRFVVGINPLAGVGDPHARAMHVLAVIKAHAESWGVQIEETLRHSLIALACADRSLVDLEPLLTDAATRGEVLPHCTDEYVLSFFERYNDLSPEQQSNWYLPVFNKVSPLLATPRLRAALKASPSLDFKKLLDTPGQVVLISLAADRFGGAAGLMGSLIVNLIKHAIMARASVDESDRVPVSLVVDEFQNFASDAFKEIIAEGRRFKIGLTLSHQNASQVPQALRSTLRSNVRTQFFFQTGAEDASALALEVSTSEPRELVRSLLLRLPRGEALLVRRGEDTARIAVRNTPDPSVDASEVDRVRTAALKRFGVSTVTDSPKASRKSEPEVRHEKLPGLPRI